MIFTLQIFWILFTIFILGAVFYDLYLQGRRKKEMTLREAGTWTLVWISLALLFNLLIYIFLGHNKALEFFTAYLLEKSLSLDNLFVFMVIFTYFGLPVISQQKVLKLGILGAFILRAIFIFGGIFLLQRFEFLFYIFGLFLIYSAIKLFFQKETKLDIKNNIFFRFLNRFKIINDIKSNKFVVNKGGKTYITILLVILVLIESSDVIFALDSVPAVLAITQNPFIAYTSNAFAILGLRALYFFLILLLPKFYYLKKAIIVLLAFIGIKMIFNQIYHMPIIYSLIFILLTLTTAILFSYIKTKKLEKMGIK